MGQYSLAKKLQRLLLTSKGANLIAVRRVSQINRGKHTPGIDGKTALTNRERKVLADMAVTDAAGFAKLVEVAKSKLA